MTDGRNPERDFRRIVGLLEGLAIPFLLVGGLAARAYGASRELADIDFYVPSNRLPDMRLRSPAFVVDIEDLET